MFSLWKSESKASPGQDAASMTKGWPWEPDQRVAAQLAIASLVKFFPKSLARNDRLHVGTLFCALGALAGFAAQYGLRERIASGKAKETDVFVIAQAPNGERYFFGDGLNAVLVPQTLESTSVWSVLGGEALRLGAAREDLPDCMEIF